MFGVGTGRRRSASAPVVFCGSSVDSTCGSSFGEDLVSANEWGYADDMGLNFDSGESDVDSMCWSSFSIVDVMGISDVDNVGILGGSGLALSQWHAALFRVWRPLHPPPMPGSCITGG